MINDEKVYDKLKRIQPPQFELMVASLIYQGAFSEVAPRDSSVQINGTNIDKLRTIRSGEHSDSEIPFLGVRIEVSAQEDWQEKLEYEVERNKSKKIKKFVFFTNQDVKNRMITVNRKLVDGLEYIKKELNCEEAYIFGSKDIILRLTDPKYFSIRRASLDIPYDFLTNIEGYKKIIEENRSYKCETPEEKLEWFAQELDKEINLESEQVLLLHNKDFPTLLHTIAEWAKKKNLDLNKEVIMEDICFLKWHNRNKTITQAETEEISTDVKTCLFIWGAHEINNLTEYLAFDKNKTLLIIVCPTQFKDDVANKLTRLRGNKSIVEISIKSIDEREVTQDELSEHQNKVQQIIENATDLLLKYEALIYLYSPFDIRDQELLNKICKILEVTKDREVEIRQLLVSSGLASITGNILWNTYHGAGKSLLNKFITDGVFDLNTLS